jgi:hypothetical protein
VPRSKVILPPDSTGQALDIVTYNNGIDDVAASVTALIYEDGTLVGPATETTLGTIAQLLRVTNARLMSISMQLAALHSPALNLDDISMLIDKEI